MYKFIQSSEEINSNGGFSFIKKLLDGNCGMPLRDSHLPAARNSRYSTASIVRSLVGIQTAGECDYADVEKFWDDFLFRELAGRQGAVRGVVQAASVQPLPSRGVELVRDFGLFFLHSRIAFILS